MKAKSDAEWYIKMAQDPDRNAYYAGLLRFAREQGMDWNNLTAEQKEAIRKWDSDYAKAERSDRGNLEGQEEVTVQIDEELLHQMEEICAAKGYTVEDAMVWFAREFVRRGRFPWEEN